MSFLDLKIKSLLNENNNKREEIRKIVRDIISIFKKNESKSCCPRLTHTLWASDLPPNIHPATIRVSAVNTPKGVD